MAKVKRNFNKNFYYCRYTDGYFKGVAMEAKKVQWPNKKELGKDLLIVLATCTAASLLLWGLDTGWLAGIKWLLARA